MDSQKGKPIHQVNYTLITSSPTDFGSETLRGGWGVVRYALGLNSKRRYVSASHPRVCELCAQWCCLLKGRRSANRLSVSRRRLGATRNVNPRRRFPPINGPSAQRRRAPPLAGNPGPEPALAHCLLERRGAGYLNIDYHILVCMRVTSGANQCQSPRSQQVNAPPPLINHAD